MPYIYIDIMLLMAGCTKSSLFQSKNVKINDEVINMPINVGEFIQKENLKLENIDGIEAKSSLTIELDNYSIIIENNTDKKVDIKDASIIGFVQSIDNMNDESKIIFPENIYVGQSINPKELVKALNSSGDIKGDVGHTTDSNLNEDNIICGKRIVNLNGDLKTASQTVIYPIEIKIKDNIITEIQMIFTDE